ncbi:MAG: methyltransferase domain-containing protein, partial [Bacteroidales bacterium]|nr:methyltransferase domain-containing protein [Bacteroidales bacterium]
IYTGLTGDFAKAEGACAMLRGVRNSIDFEFGRTMQAANRRLFPALTTVVLCTPGDVADIEVYRSKSSYMEGRILRLKKASELRCTPFCTHFGLCGGCKWQHLAYEAQLAQKQQQVRDQLERIGKVELPEPLPILGSPRTVAYRNKIEYTFSPFRWLSAEEMASDTAFSVAERAGLGFHLPGKFDKVLDIRQCHLQPEPSNQIQLFLKELALQSGLPFYHVRSGEGVWRNVILRCNERGEFMVTVVLKTVPLESVKPVFDALLQRFPEIVSLHYCFNDKPNDSIADQDVRLYAGQPYLVYRMPRYGTSVAGNAGEVAAERGTTASDGDCLKFRIGPKSFFQTNGTQAERLYRVVGDFAGLTGKELLYDLYTGTGTIGLYLADKARKVVGVEYVEDAVADARLNAADNGIGHATFFAGDMAKVFTDEWIAVQGRPDVVVTDPPREGMHEKVVEQLLKLLPPRIVYVSCNAATQARDLQRMDAQYKVVKWQAVDMFPHTYHVENVVLLERR